MSFPTIEGVAPKLPVFAEVVRRDAGDSGRSPACIKLKEFRSELRITAIGRDIDGLIAKQGDTPLARIRPKGLPLLTEQELQDGGFRYQTVIDDLFCP